MRNRIWLAVAAFLLLTGSSAWADDRSQCLSGIKAIKAAIAKKPPQPALDRLKRALDSAQQEEFEKDWDECLDAIKQAGLRKK
ncbi:MAG TPA: hypothetical protein VFA80_01080 [Xanthobacteraceae bacterium]|jgi:hypothetical protein|nr:hypothetical protein [Xanthobacteraceae bacterium]